MSDAAMTAAERAVRYRAKRKAAGFSPPPGGAAKLRALDPVERARRLAAGTGVRRQRAAAERAARPFVGCDGEGAGGDEETPQDYLLFRIGERELFTGERLGTAECLEHILQSPEGAILVGYAFGYDTTMILRDLPSERRLRLLNMMKTEGINQNQTLGSVRYTYWGNYAIEYVPRNWLRIARTVTVGNKRVIVKGSSRTIYDVFGFYQCAFVKALEDWNIGTPEVRAAIYAGKQRRDSSAGISAREREYCGLEVAMLEQLMTAFREVCRDADIIPRTWAGAGKLSAALHKAHETITAAELAELVPATRAELAFVIRPDGPPWGSTGPETPWMRPRVPYAVRAMAQEAYYGGRFEVMRTGRLGTVHEYDIRSAYPAAMANHLPCLRHGTWERLSGAACHRRLANPDAAPFVAAARFNHTSPGRANLYGLPIRTKAGRLEWPSQGMGVYWSPEVRAAVKLGCQPRFGAGWGYVRQCACQPFAWVDQLYQYRRSLGSDGRGQVIKLGINGLYGKLAQRVGNPKYSNPVWASLITAHTRAQLNEAAAHDPEAIAMLATDGIYSVRPLPLALGDALGQWEHKQHPDLFIVQPGLYWGDWRGEWAKAEADRAWKVKSRGISTGVFARADRTTGEPLAARFETVWQEWCDWMHAPHDHLPIETRYERSRPPHVEITLRLFTGLRLAQARGKPETAGVWRDRPYKVDFAWYLKRATGPAAVFETPQCVWHYPPPGGPKVVSIPHAGVTRDGLHPDLFDLVRMEYEDMPDFLDLGPQWV